MLFFLLVKIHVNAQISDSIHLGTDISDVIKKIKKKPEHVKITSNKKYLFSIVPAIGYTLQTGVAALVSANLAFYQDKNVNQKLSSINSSFTYSQFHQIILPFTANIWTKGNRINYITDFRFISYPSAIYGLGGKRISVDSNANIGYTINFLGLKLHQSIMKEIRNNLFIGGGIFFDHFWKIKALDSLHRNVARLLRRDLGTDEQASGLVFKFLYDSRINQINAENGWFANVLFRQNFEFMGSDKSWSSLQLDVRHYQHFPKNSKNVLAFWAFSWLTTSKQTSPYLLLPSIGWDDQYNSGRGYIQGRFRGKKMYYEENEYRMHLSRNGLLGGVAFINFQYFSKDLSIQYNELKMGYGLGLRIKLNKYSNTNLCLDYGFGKNGSHGFFVNLGEVF